MEFLRIVEEIQPWPNTDQTYRVAFEDSLGILCKYEIKNNRHLLDILKKFNPLPTFTAKDPLLAKVLSSWNLDGFYYVLYENISEIESVWDAELVKSVYEKGRICLEMLRKYGIHHGNIVPENIKTTTLGVKIVAFDIPKPRTFEDVPIDVYEHDVRSFCRSIVGKLESFAEELREINEIANGNIPILTFYQVSEHKESLQIQGTSGIDINSLSQHSENATDSNEESKEPHTEIRKWVVTNSKDLLAYDFSNGKLTILYRKVPLGRGFSVCSVAETYLIGGSQTEQKAYNLQEDVLVEMSPMLFPHSYHTSVLFQDKLWVVSGLNSKQCESWDGNAWQKEPSLNLVRESCTASVHDSLYVVSNGIEKLVDDHWEVLELKFSLFGTLGIFESDKFLLIGGRTNIDYNDNIIVYRNSEEETSSAEITGLFGANSHFVSEGTLYCFSNIGKLFKVKLSNLEVL